MDMDALYSVLAGRAYLSTRAKENWFPVPEGWNEAVDRRSVLDSGFEATYFQRGDEIVIAFAGTGPGLKDWDDNVLLGAGLGSQQLKDAAAYYMAVREANPNAKITLTGHSLGGGLASLVGVFFNEEAVTFDQAPFRASANNDVRNVLIGYLADQGYTEGAAIDALKSFHSDQPAANSGESNIPGIRGEAKVRGFYVQGEVLQVFKNTIGRARQQLIAHGAGDVSAIDLHSATLLTALLMNDDFRRATITHPDLGRMLFDSDLFAHSTATDQENFLDRLVRHQVGVKGGASGTITPDKMLDRFVRDLKTIAKPGGLTTSDGVADIGGGRLVSQGLIAFAMQMYYEGPNATERTKVLFSDMGEAGGANGVRFDINDVAASLERVKGYNLYVRPYLEATLTSTEQSEIIPRLSSMRDWYVQSGSSGMHAVDDRGRGAFMLGGMRVDQLTGGSAGDVLLGQAGGDVLIGNAGDDILDGGVGRDQLEGGVGNDVYIFKPGDGGDIISDSDGIGKILIGDVELTGADKDAYQSNSIDTWEDDVDPFKYRRIGNDLVITGGTLNSTDSITIKDFDFKNGELGIKLNTQVKVAIQEQPGHYFTTPDSSYAEGSAVVGESLGKRFAVAFNLGAREGDTLVLDMAGGSADVWSAVTGDQVISFANGQVVIALVEGQTELSFALLNTADVDSTLSYTLNATFVQADPDPAAQPATAHYQVELQGIDETIPDIASSNSIDGDLKPIEFPSQSGGAEWHYDQWGNVITDPAAPAPGRDDTLYDTIGNDAINAGGGNDIVWKTHGGDDVIELGSGDDELYTYTNVGGRVIARGGDGRDYLGAGSGRDVIEGGAGADGIYGSAESDQLFGDAQGNAADFIVQGATQAGSGQQGEWFDAEDGDDRIFGGAGNDLVAGGDGNDLIVTGGGTDWIWGDWNTQSGDEWRDWSVTERIETDAEGNKTYYYDVANIYGESNAGAGDDTIYAGAGDDVANGERGDDLLYMEAGNDKAWGGGGNDIVLGGAGDDILNGDNGQQFLDSSLHGSDFIDGGQGNDELFGGGGADSLYGGAGDDNLVGDGSDILADYQGDDYLDGEDGNDTLAGGGGADTLYGGAGDDELYGDSSDTPGGIQGDDYLDGGDGNDILAGGGGADTLLGGAGNDELYGELSDTPADVQGDDYLDGGSGDDLLVGGGGADSLFGGVGNDELYGESSETPVEVQGNDYLDGGEGDDILNGAGGADTLIGGVGNDQLYGDSSDTPVEAVGDDYLDGGDGEDILVGGGGADTLLGGDGNDQLDGDSSDLASDAHGDDFLDGGNGDDVLIGEGGSDTLLGGLGSDKLYGDASGVDPQFQGNDYLSGGEGDDQLVGGGGDDVLSGDAGNDVIYGDGTAAADEQGFDSLSGGDGDDVLVGGGGADTLNGDAGNDILYGDGGGIDAASEDGDVLDGGSGNDLLFGAGGADTLYGGADNDQLYGGAGDDTLNGGDGDDLLVAGSGNDVLTGGAGVDVYVYNLGDGIDVITDAGSNTLRFGYGIGVSNISLALGSLMIKVGNSGDAVHIEGFNPDDPYANVAIDRFEFADGAVLSYNELIDLGFDIDGTVGEDIIYGTSVTDRLNGYAGNDTIIAKAGNDVIDGGAGSDIMHGGLGDDVYIVDDATDTVIENVDEGHDRVESSVSYTLSDNVEDLTLTGADNVDGTGNTLDNTLLGNDGANVLSGGEGNDTLHGAGGDDALQGGAGDDALYGDVGADNLSGGAGNDQLYGGAGSDSLTGGDGADVLDGGSEADVLLGGAGADTLYGQAGDDVLDGGTEADFMMGGDGNDTYYVDNAGDVAAESSESGGEDSVVSSVSYAAGNFIENVRLTGADAIDASGTLFSRNIEGNAGDNDLYAYRLNGLVDNLPGVTTTIIAQPRDGIEERLLDRAALEIYRGNDPFPGLLELQPGTGATLVGNDGNDRLFGDLDNDTLIGGAGNDVLYGFGGSDVMIGGAGDDTYVVDGPLSLAFYASDGRITYQDTGVDTLVEDVGGGVDTVLATTDFTLADNFENLTLLNDTSAYDQDAGIYGTPASSGRHGSVGIGNDVANRIEGNDYANQLEGRGGDDALLGAGGNDRLDGGAGADTMVGGQGSDIYVVDDIGDTVTEADANRWTGGTDTVEANIDYTLGANVENLTLTGAADLTGNGNELDNVIQGNAGNNALAGFDGNDSIYGNEGQDLIAAGAGNDWIDGGTGADTMQGGTGNDHYFVDDIGDVTLENQGEGLDEVYSSVTHTLGSNVENLYLNGSAAIDGGGNSLDNLIVGNDANNTLTGEAGDDVLNANGGDDVLVGGDGNDELDGGWGSDVLQAGAGDDVLDGGLGGDQMEGGSGNDTYIVDDYGDSVVETVDPGVDSVQSSVSFTLGANVENLTLVGDFDLDGTGNDLDNVMVGTNYTNTLSGEGGNDTIDGSAGNDDLYGGLGDDYLYGGDDAVEVVYDPGGGYGDAIVASDIHGGPGGYTEILLPNDDYLDGGAGNDYIDGGSGNDTLYGRDGDDYLYGGDDGSAVGSIPPGPIGPSPSFAAFAEIAPGYGGGDVLINDQNDDYLDGGAGVDTLDGGTGNDLLYGGADSDIMYGGSGDDLLDGGTEIDTMSGGSGDDVYYVDGYVEISTTPAPTDGGSGPAAGDSGSTDSGTGSDPCSDDTSSDGYVFDGGSYGWGGGSYGGYGGCSIDGTWYRSAYEYYKCTYPEEFVCNCVTTDGGNSGGGDTGGGTPGDQTTINYVTDVVIENADEGYDIVYSAITYALTDNVEELHLLNGGDWDGTGNALDNLMFGNEGANTLAGMAGNDTLQGGAGNDVLDGGAGVDVLIGGTGDDVYVVDDLGDQIIEQAGEGVDTIRTSIAYGLVGNVENLELIGDGDINADGDATGNVLTGNAGNNVLSGNDGNDTLDGGAGTDTLIGGSGDDVYVYRLGNGVDTIEDDVAGTNSVLFGDGIDADHVVARTTTVGGVTTIHVRLLDEHGSEQGDQGLDFALNADGLSPVAQFTFNDGSSVVLDDLLIHQETHYGTFYADTIITGKHDDTVYAKWGNDVVQSGSGNDTLYGDGGCDLLYAEAGNDWLYGGSGKDLLLGGYDEDALFGGSGEDRLYGGANNDLLSGGEEHDDLFGGDGNDLIIGGKGDDDIHVECGADVVLYNRGDGEDELETCSEVESLTVSLGGGIGLHDLKLSRDEEDLVLEVGGSGNRYSYGCGENDRGKIVFDNWFGEECDPPIQPQVTLQLIMEASSEFDSASADPLYNQKVESFDFNELVHQFEAAQSSADCPSEWAIADAALDAHLGGSDTESLGGELSYRYGLNGTVNGVAANTVINTLADPKFGRKTQEFGLETGTV